MDCNNYYEYKLKPSSNKCESLSYMPYMYTIFRGFILDSKYAIETNMPRLLETFIMKLK